MKKIVVDMQIFLFGDSIAAAFKNSNYDIDVVRAETPQDTVELCRVYKPFCADVNGDGKISTVDVNKINSHAKKVNLLWYNSVLMRRLPLCDHTRGCRNPKNKSERHLSVNIA